ncbi:type II secretion system protein GspE [Candidatus Aerophobetes bacterium]|uniref:Type II secretion system protein GspE n=1 Tax=Aerophobetes bacterium TaxID=2030807 RepID=A0A662DCQ9_UNCAE|nr:MAG: type II secretion system protein GspE [Candidatus Aerophobetes bacterium]
MAKLVRMSLAEVLLKENFVEENDLKKARLYQRQHGGSLADALIKLGLVSEEQLVIGLAKQLGIPHVKLSNYKLDSEVMETLPEEVIRREKVVPLAKSGNSLTIATADPLNVLLIDSLRARTGYNIQTIVATPTEIEQVIADYFSSKAEKNISALIKESKGDDTLTVVGGEERVDLDELLHEAEQAPIIKMVNMILSRGIRERASDIHLEPFESKLQVRYRIDGILYPVMNLPKRVQNAVISRVKILSEMDIAERRLPQDGRFRVKAYNRDIDFRVSTVPTRFGEKVVLRLLDKAQLMGLTIDKLGLERDVLEKYQRAIKQPYGMIILTGPTSSGKSTSLHAAIRALNTPDKNIITIEDPVEYEQEGVNQVQVNEEIGLTFARALRAFLRQDPDIIMLGEMRDFETADIGVKAALTGHLLFTTLHTNDAAGAITRLFNMGIEPFLIAGSLIFVGAQRLMRRICKECAEPYHPSPELLRELGVKNSPEDVVFYRAKGCDVCNNTGYKGRMAVMEALEIDDDIRQLIIKRASDVEIKELALKKGMIPLKENALAKVIKGESTLEEMVRVTGGI